MKKLIFLSMVFLFIYQLKGQDTNSVTLKCDSTISRRHYYRHDVYYINERVLGKEDLYLHLNTFRSSSKELNKSRTHRAIAWSFCGSVIISCLIPNPTMVFFIWIGIPTSAIEEAIANKHLKKSIELYNREVCIHNNT